MVLEGDETLGSGEPASTLPIGSGTYLKVQSDVADADGKFRSAIHGQGAAMTWDGRLMFVSDSYTEIAGPPEGAVSEIELIPGRISLAPRKGYSASIHSADGHWTLAMQSDCNLVLYHDGTPAWASNTASSKSAYATCTNPRLTSWGSGELYIVNDDANGATKIWKASTAGATAIRFYDRSPFIVSTDQAGKVVWSTVMSPDPAHLPGASRVTVFRPEHLDTVRDLPTDTTELGTLLNDSFSTPQFWLAEKTAIASPANYPEINKLNYYGLNAIAVVPDISYARSLTPGGAPSDFASVQNPFPSDQNGIAAADGQYLTYKLRFYATNYSGDAGCSSSKGIVSTPNQGFDTPNRTSTFPVTAVIRNPYTDQAEIESIQMTSDPVDVKDVNGRVLCGIEPTLTADGQLMIWDRDSRLQYSFNSGANQAWGWSAPRSIVDLYQDQFTNSTLMTKGYGFAHQPIRDSLGTLYANSGDNDATNFGLPGAYPWVSPDGTDLFFSAWTSGDAARRGGHAVVGAGTHGQVRIIDGGFNINRRGGHGDDQSYPGQDTQEILFTTSLGRMPGMWSPLDRLKQHVFPFSDKPFVYPMFATNSRRYAEINFEESLVGNYDVFLEMNEASLHSQREAFIGYTPDTSGNFHYGTLSGGVYFPEEAFPYDDDNFYGGTSIGLPPDASKCGQYDCPMNDSLSDADRTYSGKALYFKDDGRVAVEGTSITGHKLNSGCDLSVSFALRPLKNFTSIRMIASREGTFSVSLGNGRQLQASFNIVPPGSKTTTILGTGVLPGGVPSVDAWTHIAFTYDSKSGNLTSYINGVVVSQVYLPGGGCIASTEGTKLLLGPQVKTPSGDLIYALDQFAMSSYLRTDAEIARQAKVVANRVVENDLSLPTGLNAKDVKAKLLLSEPSIYHEERVTLGQTLFASKLLSQNKNMSCSTCHVASSSLTDGAQLHTNLLAGAPGEQPHLLRNTPSLYNLAFRTSYFRDGSAATLGDQVHTVLNSKQEMGSSISTVLTNLSNSTSPNFKALFQSAFPNSAIQISEDNVQKALTEYELTLMNGNSLYDRDRERTPGTKTLLTSSQIKGQLLFYGKARCAECHAGSAFTDNQTHDLPFLSGVNADGAIDLGLQRTSATADDAHKFVTPSLRNVANTAPYFHDGSVKDLVGVVNRYSDSIGALWSSGIPTRGDSRLRPINLSGEEKNQLVDFLGTLTGE